MIACRSVLLLLIAGGLLILGCTPGNAECSRFQYQSDSNQNTALCHDPLGSALVEELCKPSDKYSMLDNPLKLEITDSQEQKLEQVLKDFLSNKADCWKQKGRIAARGTPLRLTQILTDYFHWEKQNGNFILKPQVPPTDHDTTPAVLTQPEFPRVSETRDVLKETRDVLKEIRDVLRENHQNSNVHYINGILLSVMNTLIFLAFLALISIAVLLFLGLHKLKEINNLIHLLPTTILNELRDGGQNSINTNPITIIQTLNTITGIVENLYHETKLVAKHAAEIQTKIESADLDKHLIKSTDYDATQSESVPAPEPPLREIETLIDHYNRLLDNRQLEDEFKQTWELQPVNFNASSGSIEKEDEKSAICWAISVPYKNQWVLVPARRLLTTDLNAVVADRGEGGRRLLGNIFHINYVDSIKNPGLERVAEIESNRPYRIRKKGSLLLPSNLITT